MCNISFFIENIIASCKKIVNANHYEIVDNNAIMICNQNIVVNKLY